MFGYAVLALTCGLAISHNHEPKSESEADAAVPGLRVKSSPYSVNETMTRLIDILETKGLKIIAHIRHDENAANVNLTLPPTELLIFGSPALGSQLMMESQTIGIDLPMKALAYETINGTFLAYNEPVYLGQRHSISVATGVIQKMTGALDKITDAVVKTDEWA